MLHSSVTIPRRTEGFNPPVEIAYTGRPTHPAVQHGYWSAQYDSDFVRTSVQKQE